MHGNKIYFSICVLFCAFLTAVFAPAVNGAWIEEEDEQETKKVILKKKNPAVTTTRETNVTPPEMLPPPKTNIMSTGSYITLLSTERRGTNVIVTWIDLPRTGVTYKVYRSDSAIATLSAFDNARFLGSVGDGISSFVDTPPPPGPYYYAVTATVNNVEQRVLVIDQSYTSLPVSLKPDGPDEDTLFVKNIKSFYEPNTRSVIVLWDVLTEPGRYHLYRAETPIIDSTALVNCETLDDVPSDQSFFVDRNIDMRRSYYYAALFARNDREIRVFSANNNYTTMPASITPRKTLAVTAPAAPEIASNTNTPPPVVTNVVVVTNTNTAPTNEMKQAEVKLPPKIYTVTNIASKLLAGNAAIEISWEMPADIRGPFMLLLYRAKVELSSPLLLGDFLYKSISPYENISGTRRYSFIDIDVVRETPYYYAVIVANGTSSMDHPMMPQVNYSTNAVIVPKIPITTNIVVETNYVMATNMSTNYYSNVQAITLTNVVNETVTNNVTNNITNVFTNFVTNVVTEVFTNIVTNYATVPAGSTNIVPVAPMVVAPPVTIDGDIDLFVKNTITGRFYKGLYREAAAELSLALERRDTMGTNTPYRAYLFLARCYLELKDYRQSLATFVMLRKVVPDYPQDEVDFWQEKVIAGIRSVKELRQ
ncbi:MAG: tetratricopeptide repeat protein [Spirochaetes bacterium]|nr:tetratricopeptide repeat protein [Spirochaetota bacterium]